MKRQIFSQELHEWFTAVMFYTRIPVPNDLPYSERLLNRSRRYFPLIGVMVGGIGAIVFTAANSVFPATLSVVISLSFTVLITGAFHEDGFADSCDGLGGGWNREQVLAIMKDSRIGTYGTLGLLFLISIKILAMSTIAAQSTGQFAAILIGAHCVSRMLASLMIERYDYIQDPDTSKVKPVTDQRLSIRDHLPGVITVALCLLIVTLAFPGFPGAVAAATIVALCFMHYCYYRIGGYTGDILGAVQQLSEVTIYVTAAAVI